MVEILVRQNYLPDEIKQAAIVRSEFRRNRFTSVSAHLDDLITLGKAIVLCDSHARKFWPRGARAAKYERHPDHNLRRVIGNCDVCNASGLASLFVSGHDAVEHRRNWEKSKRAMEYGRIVTS